MLEDFTRPPTVPQPPTRPTLYPNQVFDAIDTNNDGVIDFAEFAAASPLGLQALASSTRPSAPQLAVKLDALFPNGRDASPASSPAAVHELPLKRRAGRTNWGEPSDQFARFGKPARVLHRNEAERELNAKGYNREPDRWSHPSKDFGDMLHQLPHGNDEHGRAVEAEYHTHHPYVPCGRDHCTETHAAEPEHHAMDQSFYVYPAEQTDEEQSHARWSGSAGSGAPVARRAMSPERVMHTLHDWQSHASLSASQHKQVFLGGVISGPTPAARPRAPGPSDPWLQPPAAALDRPPATPLQMSAAAGSHSALGGQPSQSHLFSASMKLQTNAAGSTPNQVGQVRRSLAEWLDVDHSCVELRAENGANSRGVGGGLEATLRITIPSMPTSVPLGLASRLEAFRQGVLAGGLELAGVGVSNFSELREMAAATPAGVSRMVRQAVAPVSIKTGEEGHAWREYERMVSKPAVPDDAPLSHQAVQGWMHYHAVERRVMSAAARRWQYNEMKSKFSFWRSAEMTKATSWYRSVLWLRMRVGHSMREWHSTACEMKHAKACMKGAIKRLIGDAVHHSLVVWRMVWAQTYYSISIHNAGLQGWSDIKKAAALAMLRSSASSSKLTNCTATAALKKLKNRNLSMALHQWWSTHLQWMYQRSGNMRVARRLLLLSAGNGFRTWRLKAHEQAEVMSRMRKAVNRIIQRGLFKAFFGWYDVVMDIRRKKAVGRRAFLRMLNASIARCFGTWRELLVVGAKESAAARMAKRMLNVKLAAAFGTWRETATEMKDQERSIRGVLTRMLNRKLSAAWNHWYSISAQSRGEQDLLRNFLNKLVNQKLAACCNTWRTNAAEMKRQKFAMAGFLRRMRNAKLSQAWEKWQDVAAEMKREEQTMRKVVMRLLRGKLAAAFGKWRQAAGDETHQKKLLEGVIRRMLHQKLSQAFESLQAHAAAMREDKKKCLRCVSRMLNRKLSNAWRCWHDMAMAMAKQDSAVGSVVRKWQMRDVILCWDKWRGDASEATLCSFGLGTAHWAVRATVTAFMSWRVLAAQQMVMQDWWAQSGVQSALGKWNERAGALHLFDRPSQSQEGAMELTGAYSGWLSSLKDGREKGLLVMWAAIWWSITRIRVNLALWNEASRSRIEESEISRCAASFWDQRAQASSLILWQWWARPLGSARILWSKLHPKRRQLALSKQRQAMRKWRECALGQGLQQSAQDKLQAFGVMRPRQCGALKKWRSSAKTGRRVQQSVVTLEGRNMEKLPPWAKHRMNWGMEVWREKAPKGVGGLAYSSASLANESDRGAWASTMSQFYLGLRSPAAYRRRRTITKH